MINIAQLYGNELKSRLLQLPVAKAESGGKFIVTRCPYCKDSVKHTNKGHFYVYVGFKGDELPYVKCFRQQCQVKGIVTENVLKELGILDVTLLNLHREFFKNKKYNNIKYGNMDKYSNMTFNKRKIKLLPPLNTDITKTKIQYLNTRFGFDFSVQDLLDYKIVLNFYDFLKYNKIERYFSKRFKPVADGFDKQFVGFLSADNYYLTLRNIGKVDEINKRYQNFNIFNVESTEIDKSYIIPNKVDILQKSKIILAEGIPDIIGIHNHIYNRETDNNIFCAICGSGYEKSIKKFMRMGLIHSDIDIYSDKEVEIEYYKRLKKQLNNDNIFKGNLNVYYNKINKDFGETKDKIKLFKFKI